MMDNMPPHTLRGVGLTKRRDLKTALEEAMRRKNIFHRQTGATVARRLAADKRNVCAVMSARVCDHHKANHSNFIDSQFFGEIYATT